MWERRAIIRKRSALGEWGVHDHRALPSLHNTSGSGDLTVRRGPAMGWARPVGLEGE